MRNENSFTEQSDDNTQTNQSAAVPASADQEGSAFEYLKSLPRNLDRPALDSYRRGRTSTIVDSQVAEDFTDSFRAATTPFFIPVSWTLSKAALVNLLGITSYTGYSEVTGVRFYAGLNDDNQLTLIAVSTKAGTGCSDDLTVSDSYPYYDYADPCPSNCSNLGNLRVQFGAPAAMKVVVTP